MHVARGVLTMRGGMTSHAAVIARGLGPALRRRRRATCGSTRRRAR